MRVSDAAAPTGMLGSARARRGIIAPKYAGPVLAHVRRRSAPAALAAERAEADARVCAAPGRYGELRPAAAAGQDRGFRVGTEQHVG